MHSQADSDLCLYVVELCEFSTHTHTHTAQIRQTQVSQKAPRGTVCVCNTERSPAAWNPSSPVSILDHIVPMYIHKFTHPKKCQIISSVKSIHFLIIWHSPSLVMFHFVPPTVHQGHEKLPYSWCTCVWERDGERDYQAGVYSKGSWGHRRPPTWERPSAFLLFLIYLWNSFIRWMNGAHLSGRRNIGVCTENKYLFIWTPYVFDW